MVGVNERFPQSFKIILFIVIVVNYQSTKAKDFSCKTNEVQFRCHTGDKCIPKKWECDGENDCGDNSDEKHCSKCDSEKFLCDDGSHCILMQWTCDSTYDCLDKSDENPVMCGPRTCSPSEFSCPNNRCIPLVWKCDAEDDCDDGSDEQNCERKECKKTMFQCANGRCIDKNWRCDFDNDCDDMSDEQGCGAPRPCTHDEFHCNNSQCIPEKRVCDNFYDCKDKSDEPPNCKPKKSQCKDDYFDCKDGECIHKTWKCDGDSDCASGEDEANCSCPPGRIQCQNTGDCIEQSLRCDGKNDCNDGSDERSCVSEKGNKCKKEQFECIKSNKCVNSSVLCDGKKDCDDGSDETEPCTNGKCYELGKCSQACEVNKGIYKCSCVAGYHLDGKDQKSCKAIERDPYLVFSDRHSIRKLDLHKSEFLGVVPNLPGSIALDYDLANNWMYWTDVSDQAIQRTVLSNKNNKSTKKETIISGIRGSDGIAIDWVARKLYWTDSWLKRIEVSELNGEMRLPLIVSGLENPRAVVLYPAIGEMFWTDWGSNAKIERCGMDGDPTSRKAIVTKDILWPNALTLDYTIDRIWWADAKRHVIEHCDLNGEHRKVILSKEHIFHPFSISVFEDNVYWTDWFRTSIFKANKFTGTDVKRIKKDLLHPNGITVIHPQRKPPAFNFCQKYNGFCSHLCLLSARQNKTKLYSCACPGGIKMLEDGRTCDTPESKRCGSGMCNNGTCLPGNDHHGPTCVCNNRFSGLRCEYKIPFQNMDNQSSSDDIAVTIGISVGVVLLIFLTGAIVGILIYRRLQKRYDPSSLNFDNPVYTKTTETIESGGSNLLPFRFRRSPPQQPFARDPEPVDL